MSLILQTDQEIREALDMASEELLFDEAELEGCGAEEVRDHMAEYEVMEVVGHWEGSDAGAIHEALEVDADLQEMQQGPETFELESDDEDDSSVEENCEESAVRTLHLNPKKTLKRLKRNGRPRDPVRNEFEKQPSGKVKCKACSAEVSDRCDVMKGHKRSCKRQNPNLKPQSELGGACNSTYAAHNARRITALTSCASIMTASGTESASSSKTGSHGPEERQNVTRRVTSQTSIKSFLDTITAKEWHQLDLKVAKMVYACNAPFRIVSNEEFRAMIKALRPAYEPPTERQVGNELLEEVYSETKDTITEAVSGQDVVMVQDGWSTRKNQPVIAHSLQCGTKNFFYNAICTGTSSKTAEYLATLLFDTIDECQMKHGCTVVGVVTDSCNTMTALRSIVESLRPTLFVYGCSAHYLNNVGVKVTPTEKLKNVTDIQKFFKNHHFQSAVLDEDKDGKRPALSCSSRWNSQLACLQTFLDNHAVYLDTVRKHPKKFTIQIADLIKDPMVYEQALEWRDIAKPVAEALTVVESNRTTLSQAVSEWLSLEPKLQIQDENVQEYFWEKYHEALSPVALSAYILDPRFRGKDLSPTQVERALTWLGNIHEDLVVMAIELEAKNRERFPSYLLKEETIRKTDPKSFWINVEKHGVFNPFCCQIARKLQVLPASGSGIERCFSTLGNILSPQRNNLAVEKASKLCIIYQSLRFLKCEEELDAELSVVCTC